MKMIRQFKAILKLIKDWTKVWILFLIFIALVKMVQWGLSLIGKRGKVGKNVFKKRKVKQVKDNRGRQEES